MMLRQSHIEILQEQLLQRKKELLLETNSSKVVLSPISLKSLIFNCVGFFAITYVLYKNLVFS